MWQCVIRPYVSLDRIYTYYKRVIRTETSTALSIKMMLVIGLQGWFFRARYGHLKEYFSRKEEHSALFSNM